MKRPPSFHLYPPPIPLSVLRTRFPFRRSTALLISQSLVRKRGGRRHDKRYIFPTRLPQRRPFHSDDAPIYLPYKRIYYRNASRCLVLKQKVPPNPRTREVRDTYNSVMHFGHIYFHMMERMR